jgi:hypothetical protein
MFSVLGSHKLSTTPINTQIFDKLDNIEFCNQQLYTINVSSYLITASSGIMVSDKACRHDLRGSCMYSRLHL